MTQTSPRPEMACAKQEATSSTRQGPIDSLHPEDRTATMRYRIAASAAIWKNLMILEEHPELNGEIPDQKEKLALCHHGCLPHVCNRAIILHCAGKGIESQFPGESAFFLDPSRYQDHCPKLTWIDVAAPWSEPQRDQDDDFSADPDHDSIHPPVEYGTYVEEAYDD